MITCPLYDSFHINLVLLHQFLRDITRVDNKRSEDVQQAASPLVPFRTADRLAQLVEHQTTVWEVSGLIPRQDQHSGS